MFAPWDVTAIAGNAACGLANAAKPRAGARSSSRLKNVDDVVKGADVFHRHDVDVLDHQHVPDDAAGVHEHGLAVGAAAERVGPRREPAGDANRLAAQARQTAIVIAAAL